MTIDTVKKFLKDHFGTLVFFAVAGLVGGFFTGLFVLDSYPEQMRQQLLSEGMNGVLLGIVTAIQGAAYGVILGAFGILLGKKIGLYKGERTIEKKPLLCTMAVSLIGGLSMILFDLLWFGRVSDAIMQSYMAKPSLAFIVGSVIYGGVIEEVMLRLFWMSLVAFLLSLIVNKGQGTPSAKLIIVANIIAALLFALGHLPATAALLGITPLIVFRCILLNGGIGFMFGWLYHRFGLRYSMIAHAGCHVISKLIWIIFV